MDKSKLGYWILTAFVGLSLTGSASFNLMSPPELLEGMAHLGFPVAGDPLYATGARISPAAKSDDRTLGLHAWKLAFDHPSGGRVDAVAPPSRKFMELAREVGLSNNSLPAQK
jgi:hypothetical protein